jgi:hypothetical protein
VFVCGLFVGCWFWVVRVYFLGGVNCGGGGVKKEAVIISGKDKSKSSTKTHIGKSIQEVCN